LRSDLALDALEQALYDRALAATAPLVHHSDRGGQLEQPDHRLGQGVIVRIPTRPTDRSMPASANRSVYRIDR
jgi:hypothetical protein